MEMPAAVLDKLQLADWRHIIPLEVARHELQHFALIISRDFAPLILFGTLSDVSASFASGWIVLKRQAVKL